MFGKKKVPVSVVIEGEAWPQETALCDDCVLEEKTITIAVDEYRRSLRMEAVVNIIRDMSTSDRGVYVTWADIKSVLKLLDEKPPVPEKPVAPEAKDGEAEC